MDQTSISKQAQQSLIIRIPRKTLKRVQAVVPAPVHPVARGFMGLDAFEPPIPPPPLPLPIVAESSVDQKEIEYTFQLSDDADLFELNSEELGVELNTWLNTMPDPAVAELYLVRFDSRLCRHITFCDGSRKELIRKYVMHVANDTTTPEHQTIHTFSEKLPEEQIKERAGSYVLACIVKGCLYQETQLSVKELKVKMFLHHLIEHQRDSEWYQSIDRRIKENFEEALEALKESIK